MAKQHYIGVGGIARRVKDTHIGVNGVARRVIRGYVGVSGIAQEIICNTVIVTTKIEPSSTVSGTPTGTAAINASGTTLSLSFTSARTTNENYNTDRNKFYVYLTGIVKGDSVQLQIVDDYPIASTEVLLIHSGTTIKKWNEYGTNTFTFTANATAPILILIDDGDYNQRSDTITVTVSDLTVNGNKMEFVKG